MSRTEHSPLLAAASDFEIVRLGAYAAAHVGRMTPDLTMGKHERAAALVRYYAGLCRGVGVDPVLAVCQSWHETAMWSSWWFREPRRNPAGIGVNGAKADRPGKGEWQPTDDGRWAKGQDYRSYATAAMSHVHGLALWAGADLAAVHALADRCRAARELPYSPPAAARGSCTEWRHLGWRHNPRKIGWAHPGDQYGAAIARLARVALGV